jgi:hypothetical protein
MSGARPKITRELQWMPDGATTPRTIRVSVGLPEPHPELRGFQCTVDLEGFEELMREGERASSTFHNEDGMLALTAALNMVPHVIEYCIRKAGGGRPLAPLRLLEDTVLRDGEEWAPDEPESGEGPDPE